VKTREQKKEIIDRIEDAVKTSPSSVFVHFTGLNVGDETQMRNELRKEGISYYIARKTLMRRALDGAKVEGEQPALEGEIAIVWGSDDPTAPARNVYTFVKKHPKSIFIAGGVYEGHFLDAEGMSEIATIPSVDVLRGMFVNVINSPIQGLAVALGQIAEQKA
jgi:large subunit ribosomal protein L10